jgi:hypothetical protein
MPSPGRNEPCACGSGCKTKRCCGQARGPSDEQLACARLAALARDAITQLAGLSDAALERLDDDLFELPGVDLSLHARLPEFPGPDRRRLQQAMAADSSDDGAWQSIKAIARRLDTPEERARLAESAIGLRDRGLISHAEAAYAVYDLSSASTRFITASVIHALATHLGGDPTPGGLLVAA